MCKRSVVGVLAVGCMMLMLVLSCCPVVSGDNAPAVQIQVKSEIYEITPEMVRDFVKSPCISDITNNATLGTASVKHSDVEAFRTHLRDLGAKLLGSPIISTLNNHDASISINTSGESGKVQATKLLLTPQLNSDKSVTLSFFLTVPEEGSATETVSGIATTTKIATENSAVIYDINKALIRNLLVIVTPTVVK